MRYFAETKSGARLMGDAGSMERPYNDEGTGLLRIGLSTYVAPGELVSVEYLDDDASEVG